MKREHITIPTLHIAAAAFFFASAQAKLKCVDETSTIVAASNCDGTQPANTFFLVPGRDSSVKIDAADPVARKAAGRPESGLVSGGFGRRQEPSADSFKREAKEKVGNMAAQPAHSSGGNSGGGKGGSGTAGNGKGGRVSSGG